MPLITVDAQTVPVHRMKDASSLISDSGITRGRFEAEIWDIHSNNGDEYWHFPEKIYMEQFDSLFNVTASIVADTAYNYLKKELWHAIGNVVVKNEEGTTFETSELFWDRKIPPGVVGAFYTHQFVKITHPNGDITYGYDGFRAEQSLNIFRLYSGKGDILIEEDDSLQRDATEPDELQLP